ncbi:hypothetical protein ACFFVB_18385 [Formosa undariae]|uniref:Uncharacterized protein n=1 Tax=Formosa undariae TaxID=1325436 RepID=A0ABV5F6M2_9FLAO
MNKISTTTKIIICACAILVLALVFKPNLSKKIYDLYKQELDGKSEIYKMKYEVLQQSIRLDSIQYVRRLDSLQKIIDAQNIDLEDANKKIEFNEKAIATYRRGNYNERFIIFSELVTRKD